MIVAERLIGATKLTLIHLLEEQKLKIEFIAIKYVLIPTTIQKGEAAMGEKDKGSKEQKKKPKLNPKEKKKLKQEKKKNK